MTEHTLDHTHNLRFKRSELVALVRRAGYTLPEEDEKVDVYLENNAILLQWGTSETFEVEIK
jgi:hypothetical protein